MPGIRYDATVGVPLHRRTDIDPGPAFARSSSPPAHGLGLPFAVVCLRACPGLAGADGMDKFGDGPANLAIVSEVDVAASFDRHKPGSRDAFIRPGARIGTADLNSPPQQG